MKIKYLLLYFISLFSCSENKKQDSIHDIHFAKGDISISESCDYSFVRLETNKEKIKHPDLSAIADNITPDDNPILCFMKWKK